ncbi:serine--tRNA ligase [Mycoplasmopsis columbinasalis]|uniref:Serine--tRNA ligase n=1 Tax=Mycoplasmopsis columbinasalis TaxID=114880 RepID=A0A449BAC0_9BACT|nr:serine--tRNA ligase [Mycoplasmopsis columbinasalis]VEU78144.1 seryl-tRNA synthetase [Mycoplasmopsis columbinasalis]
MLNLKFLLENEAKVRSLYETRKVDYQQLDRLYAIAKERGQIMFEAQQKKAQLSAFSKEFVRLKDNPNELANLKKQIEVIKKEQLTLEKNAKTFDDKVQSILETLPNLPLDEVPLGNSDLENKVLAVHDKLGRGLVVKGIKPHYEIAYKLGLFETERAVKLSGSRFVIYRGQGAKLVRALKNFLLDLHAKNGYEEVEMPVLVKPEIMFGTGQLPKFKEDLFFLEKENLYLIPTAEVPVTNIYNNEIVDLSTPQRFTAYTECFRSEAGSGGKDTKGIIRLHQFKKVELVEIVTEDDGLKEFEYMLKEAKLVLEELELPYRELLLCRGDLGFSARKTIDLEVWLPSEFRFREISSVSYMGDFQARRAMIRYRDQNGDTKYAHTMNGSGLAIDRLVAAILENYQNEDGTITVPTKLVPYMNGQTIIK